MNIHDESTSKYNRNLEKVTVSMANLNSGSGNVVSATNSNDLLLTAPNKDPTIISPIFNSQVVVSTSTPSLANEQDHGTLQRRQQDSINNSSNIMTSAGRIDKSLYQQSTTTMTMTQVSSNQGLVKIVSDHDKLNSKPTRNSTLIELDKCIAEFDKYKYLAETDSSASKPLQSKDKDKDNSEEKSNEQHHQNKQQETSSALTPTSATTASSSSSTSSTSGANKSETVKPSAVIEIVKPPTLHYYHQSSVNGFRIFEGFI